jgi:hypothetical protein
MHALRLRPPWYAAFVAPGVPDAVEDDRVVGGFFAGADRLDVFFRLVRRLQRDDVVIEKVRIQVARARYRS